MDVDAWSSSIVGVVSLRLGSAAASLFSGWHAASGMSPTGLYQLFSGCRVALHDPHSDSIRAAEAIRLLGEDGRWMEWLVWGGWCGGKRLVPPLLRSRFDSVYLCVSCVCGCVASGCAECRVKSVLSYLSHGRTGG